MSSIKIATSNAIMLKALARPLQRHTVGRVISLCLIPSLLLFLFSFFFKIILVFDKSCVAVSLTKPLGNKEYFLFEAKHFAVCGKLVLLEWKCG